MSTWRGSLPRLRRREIFGKLAPTFDARSLDGEALNLATLRGKVVVLNFWYVSCGPCRVKIPGLNQLVSEFQGKGVVFIALALDRAEARCASAI
jgi:peroxiredoxin